MRNVFPVNKLEIKIMDSFRNNIKKLNKPLGLLESSHSYKPFRYPWAYDFWKRQQQVHWMPEEVPLGEDCKDWVIKLNDGERNLLTQIFRFLLNQMLKSMIITWRIIPEFSNLQK